jgi:hypothetical protein
VAGRERGGGLYIEGDRGRETGGAVRTMYYVHRRGGREGERGGEREGEGGGVVEGEAGKKEGSRVFTFIYKKRWNVNSISTFPFKNKHLPSHSPSKKKNRAVFYMYS